MISNDKNTE